MERIQKFSIEIANRIARGRAVGTDYVVTRRPVGQTCIVFRSGDRQDCVAFIDAQEFGAFAEDLAGLR